MPFDYIDFLKSDEQEKKFKDNKMVVHHDPAKDSGVEDFYNPIKKDEDVFFKEIIKSKKISELVKLMRPLDVMRSLTDVFSLQPKQSANLVIKLLCHVHEWITPPGEPSHAKSYPGKPGEDVSDRDERIKDYLPDDIEEYSNFVQKMNFNSNTNGEGPASKSIQRSAPWPYGAYNVSLMDPHNKSSESMPVGSVNVATSIKAIGGNANKAMGVGGSGQGTFQKSNPHSQTGTMAMNGNVFGGRGVPGLSSSPRDKEFNTPEESENGKQKDSRFRRKGRK